MSRAASSFAGRPYGVVRVTREWEMARSGLSYQRGIAAQPERVLRRWGPKTAWSDAALLEKIRAVLAALPFYGEGHRKVCARLRFEGVRTLRKPENPLRGTILTARSNEVWASNHTATATIKDGPMAVFLAVDHSTTQCVGIHAAKKPRVSRRWNPCSKECATTVAASASALLPASATGTTTAASTCATTIKPPGPSWASGLRPRSCGSWNATARAEFRQRHNPPWIGQPLGYLTPDHARQNPLGSERRHEYTQFNAQQIRTSATGLQ
jgi:hypothetical protein